MEIIPRQKHIDYILMMNLLVRDATEDDAGVVAWTVLTALDLDTSDMDRMLQSCSDVKSMYSWRNSIVACDGGKVVGCIVCYEGDRYESMRQYTWSRLWGAGEDEIRDAQRETGPGEFYLDSLAIVPEYRGMGIGKLLIEAAINRGRELGYHEFSLLVSVKKTRLKAYYESLGFRKSGRIMFFGYEYDILRMTLPE